MRKTFHFSPELSFLNHLNHPTVACNSVGAKKKKKGTLLTKAPPEKRLHSNYLLPFKSGTTVTLCRPIAPTELKTFFKQLENVLKS